MFRRQLNYANVMASIAVFAALGGGVAVAATAKRDTVTSKSIRDGQVRTKDIADESVTSAKVEDGSVTGDDVAEGSLVFRCSDGEFAASGGGPCFFVIDTSGSTWQQAIAECAARRAQIPTIAEIAAIVPIGPSPAANITTWSSDIVTPPGVGPAEKAWTVSSANGTLNVIGQTFMNTSVITKVLCRYDPANSPG